MFSKLLHRIDDLERASSQFTAVYDWDEQQPIIGSNSFSRGQQQQREMVVPASPVPSTAPTTISSSENLQVPRSPSGPLRKQVSFKVCLMLNRFSPDQPFQLSVFTFVPPIKLSGGARIGEHHRR